MRDDAQIRNASYGGKARQYRGRRIPRARYGNIVQILQRCHAVLWRLRCDRIAHAILRIQPESRRSLRTATERYQQIGCDVALGESNLGRFRTVHSDMQLRLIKCLLNAEIGCSGNCLYTLQ